LSPTAREVSIQEIGPGRYKENDQRDEGVRDDDIAMHTNRHVPLDQCGHQQRNEKDPE
jgi:hypothetical protein